MLQFNWPFKLRILSPISRETVVHLQQKPTRWQRGELQGVCMYFMGKFQFRSVAQSCVTLCDPMDCSTPVFPVHHQFPEILKLMSLESVMPSKYLILSHPLLLLPSIFLSIGVLSNESVLCIKWPKYWSFGISPSNEYSGLMGRFT